MDTGTTIDLASGFLSTVFSFLMILRLWRLRREDIKVIPGYYSYSSLVQTIPTHASIKLTLYNRQ
jgi:hypothetical protein